MFRSDSTKMIDLPVDYIFAYGLYLYIPFQDWSINAARQEGPDMVRQPIFK